MKVIVYEKGDGVVILKPCYNDRVFKDLKYTEDQILNLVLRKDMPQGAKCKIMEYSALPDLPQGTRNQWKFCPANGIRLDSK